MQESAVVVATVAAFAGLKAVTPFLLGEMGAGALIKKASTVDMGSNIESAKSKSSKAGIIFVKTPIVEELASKLPE